jgi:2-polyprenyl-3-methyl-5-hydroxy-6-metoxy-1,4-benzoquinol methylase
MENIIKDFLKSDDFDYGYYGLNTFFLKRWLWWSRLKLANKIYLNHESQISKNNLLDFGCDFSFFSAYLSRKFKKIHLVELNEYFLNHAVTTHKKFGNNNYVTLVNPKDDSSFFVDKIPDRIDLFLFFDVLEHVRDIDRFLLRLKDMASENSYVLISLPTENLFYMILTKFKKEKDHCNRYFEVEKVLKKNNYKLIEKRSLLFLFNIYLYKV